ncbi:MAG: MFS transporter [Lachnospiraceae bacterium]|nr:MFS transporter [Lachnospiraceae bacterium]
MKDEKKQRLWTRDFLIVCVVATLLRICMQFKSSVLPLYVVELGFSKSAAGLTTTAYTLAALVFRPVVGNLIDTQGRKRLLIVGATLVAVTMFPFCFLTALPCMYALQIVSGIGFSIQSVSLSTMTTDLVPEKRLTEGLGYYGLTSTISQAVGPALALWMAGVVGYGIDFAAGGCFCLLALALMPLIRYEKRRIQELQQRAAEAEKTSEPQTEERPARWWHRIVEPTALIPSLLMVGVSFASSSVTTFLATYGSEKGIENIGLFFTVQAAGLAVSRAFAGKLTTRFGSKRCLMWGLVGMMVAFVGIRLSPGIYPLLIIGVVYAMGVGLAMVVLNAAAVLNTPAHRRGAANATFYLAQDGGLGLGAALFGVAADAAGTGVIYLLAAILCGVVLLAVKPACARVRMDG